jgi:sucrose phosphorylase
LQALYDGDGDNIKAWWLKCPRNQITTLDTHDGLGVVDVADLMTMEQTERTKANIFNNGANANMRAIGGDVKNLDIYQVRPTKRRHLRKKCTYHENGTVSKERIHSMRINYDNRA